MIQERYVVPLEQAIRLKELGVPQKSTYHWYYPCGTSLDDATFELVELSKNNMPFEDEAECYSAFHAGELLEMLPGSIQIKKFGNLNACEIRNYHKNTNMEFISGVYNIVEALASMLETLTER